MAKEKGPSDLDRVKWLAENSDENTAALARVVLSGIDAPKAKAKTPKTPTEG